MNDDLQLAVGIDLMQVSEVAESLAEHGERYLRRIFDGEERTAAGHDAARLAGCFAAKEATLKALRPERTEAIGWREMALRLDPHPRVELSGGAAGLARRRGVRGLSVSLTRSRGSVCAVVVAELER